MTVTCNGKEALEVMRGNPEDPFSVSELGEDEELPPRFDLVLMDLLMPVMDGLRAVEKFRDWEEDQKPRRKRMLIFALTGNVSGESVGSESVFLARACWFSTPFGAFFPSPLLWVGGVCFRCSSGAERVVSCSLYLPKHCCTCRSSILKAERCSERLLFPFHTFLPPFQVARLGHPNFAPKTFQNQSAMQLGATSSASTLWFFFSQLIEHLVEKNILGAS